MKRRNLILLLGGGGSAALSTGTGAFSSASADRSVEMSVVEDENAYVGYKALPEVKEDKEQSDDKEKKSITVEDGDRVTLLRVANRFPENSGIGIVGIDFADNKDLFSDLAVELSTDDEYEQMGDSEVRRGPFEDGGPVRDEYAFGPGEYAYVTADVHGDPGPYDIEITIRVRGTEDTGVSASIFGDTRAFKLRIEADDDGGTATVSGVEFRSGSSGVVLNTRQSDNSPGTASAGGNSSTEITAFAYYEDGGEVKKTDEAEVSADKKIKLKDFDDSLDNGKRIVGIEVKGISGVFDRGQTSASGNSDNYSGTTDGTVKLEDASFYEQFVDD
ncbi:hypothetical protein EXE49_04810 [Halorubrum sp. ASP121]|uniref:hypothetical protein n=1 Tax=Halorubrum sp. ASP121 TaxID=1855858 RepID=UPI0010F771A8|nr:hypothetical protein [Halorubrum sp. ASP121]TKX50954.1 hypothetical protein EXE49_04810 [Halorubrum sp. ASP121]